MLIGVPKEIKNLEYRIGLTPAGVAELVRGGHQVISQKNGAASIGFDDEQYRQAGAEIVAEPSEIFDRAQLIVKVKEPQPGECRMLHPDQTLFTYLHLAPDPEQTRLLVKSGATCIAYETVTDDDGGLPLLTPMSEVAGRMSIQAGAHCLEKAQGGSGILLSGVPGVKAANVLIIGGGVAGLNAARIAMGMGAKVTIVDRSLHRLKEIDAHYGNRLSTLYSTTETIEKQLAISDLVIGAVLIPGAAAPKLVTRKMLKLMQPGSVLVDVAIDQGGCFETSRATTHEHPTYTVDGIIHYCVANMPGGVARTSTLALTNATLPYVIALADQGTRRALANDIHLMNGLNVHKGMVTVKAVADALGYHFTEPVHALQSDILQKAG
ncbi:MAG: alanine dehydrogenase [Gammaproteobacteria bacterium]|jgi:alanine dehydrogenase|nr:alanine dehydrogenase [Gammaproteobacteria bacterium]MDP7455036.1 alanine dehydrogenase [Gammaproteobacteria bacterium]